MTILYFLPKLWYRNNLVSNEGHKLFFNYRSSHPFRLENSKVPLAPNAVYVGKE